MTSLIFFGHMKITNWKQRAVSTFSTDVDWTKQITADLTDEEQKTNDYIMGNVFGRTLSKSRKNKQSFQMKTNKETKFSFSGLQILNENKEDKQRQDNQ